MKQIGLVGMGFIVGAGLVAIGYRGPQMHDFMLALSFVGFWMMTT